MNKIIAFVIIILVFFNLNSQIKITSEEIYNHIDFLANDSLQGRFPGTKGDKIAANYIFDEFKNTGLSFFNDNPFQKFKIVTKRKFTNKSLKIDDFSCKYGEEFIPLSFSPSAQITAKVVFASYGMTISDSNYIWNDYKNIDVNGKWVMIFRGKPQVVGYPNTFFDNFTNEYSKVLRAYDNGAIGVIFINNYFNGPNDNLAKPCFHRVKQKAEIPAFSIKRFTGNRILKSINKTVKQLEQEIKRNNAPLTYDLDVTVSAKINLKPVEVTTQNIIAYLPGQNPSFKNQYIVIGAHYDHLGFGGCGSGSKMPDTIAVHNGADDNASGVAGVIEIAEYLYSVKEEIGRSIIFVAFGAEERGLLGSDYFINNPPVEKKNIYAMINFDMIGKYNGKLSILGIGSAKEFKDIIKTTDNDTSLLKIELSEKAYSGSDHASFIKNDIPAVFFYSSSGKNYHTPFDDVQYINSKKQAQLLKFASNFTLNLSNFQHKLTFVDVENISKGNHHYDIKVKLGIVPSFEDTKNKGLKIGGIVDNKPAHKAGMKTGDIITAINDKVVKNIYDYMARLQELSPGQLIDVKIRRNNEIINLKVQL